MKATNEETIRKIKDLHGQGKTFYEIANELGVSWATARHHAVGAQGGTKAGKRGRPKGSGKTSAKKEEESLMLRVPADDKLCDEVWARLSLPQKVAALNSLE